MSERVQNQFKDRADRAREREQSARQRADTNHQHGDHRLADLHEQAALAHARAAGNAEGALAANQRVEGDRLSR